MAETENAFSESILELKSAVAWIVLCLHQNSARLDLTVPTVQEVDAAIENGLSP